MGLFLEDLRRFFIEDLLNKAHTLEKTSIIQGKAYLGVDCAGLGKDKNAFQVIDKIAKEKMRHVESITSSKEYTNQTKDRIVALHNTFRFKKIGVDDGGVGFGVFSELLADPKTRDRVIALNNASRAIDNEKKKEKKILKTEMYFNLLNLLEKGHLKLLKDGDVRASLASVQIEEKNDKIFIFGKDTHICEGLIRAAWLAVQDTSLSLWAR